MLDELPSDVLVSIFSYLPLDEIFSCAFVSQTFRRNAKFHTLRLVCNQNISEFFKLKKHKFFFFKLKIIFGDREMGYSMWDLKNWIDKITNLLL